jgi:asparagine synthase (glutamine-hydrolysing)
MCGICGAVGIESKDESAAILARMLRSIHHRGPDEEGALIAPLFAAGTRRLSIIDLAGGSQPIWNETRTLAICFNGEIYNFRELRDELLAAGHQFRTRSDTEVIVHAYEQWGTQGFARLHGMFAFVLAEMPAGPEGPVKRVVLARDRFGIKPLYYAAVDGALLFASEVRALLASGLVPAQISEQAMSSYLFFGSVGEPNTLVDNVYSLPPAHFAEFSTQAPVSSPAPRAYWTVSDRAKVSSASSAPLQWNGLSPAKATRSHLESAVSSHLIADVPVGVFLSSGLDSTAIAALAARAHPGIHTFTVAFPDLEFSEAEEARRTADRLGTQHSELQLSGDEMLARLDEAIAAFDQPSMDGINTYFVSWAARQSGLKVALSGLGSDEIFGGYPTFRTAQSVARLAHAARFVPLPLRRAAVAAARLAKPGYASTPAFEKAMAAWLAPNSLPGPYFFTRALFTPQQLPELSGSAASNPEGRGFSPAVSGGEVGTSAPEARVSSASANSQKDGAPWWTWLANSAQEARHMDAFTAVSWLELRSYMLNTLLRDTDSMSMANSLEVRVPFLDVPLVDYILSLPESQKRGPHGPKSLLISALSDLLPKGIVGQRKRTFTFPWEKWLRGPLREHVTAGLSDWSPALAPILSRDFALRVWHDFQQGRTTWSRPWSLYVLNEWAKRHLSSNRPLSHAARNKAENAASHDSQVTNHESRLS